MGKINKYKIKQIIYFDNILYIKCKINKIISKESNKIK